MERLIMTTYDESYEKYKSEMEDLIEHLDCTIIDEELNPKLIFSALGFNIVKDEFTEEFKLGQDYVSVFKCRTLRESVFHANAAVLAMNKRNIFTTFNATRTQNQISLQIYDNYENNIKIFSGVYGNAMDKNKEWVLMFNVNDSIKQFPEIKSDLRQDLVLQSHCIVAYINHKTKSTIFKFIKQNEEIAFHSFAHIQKKGA